LRITTDEEGHIVPASHYGLSGDFPSQMLLTVLFEDYDGKTRLTLRSLGMPPGVQTELARDGWNTSLDKLAELLKELEKQPA
jgi:hypothetical protein